MPALACERSWTLVTFCATAPTKLHAIDQASTQQNGEVGAVKQVTNRKAAEMLVEDIGKVGAALLGVGQATTPTQRSDNRAATYIPANSGSFVTGP